MISSSVSRKSSSTGMIIRCFRIRFDPFRSRSVFCSTSSSSSAFGGGGDVFDAVTCVGKVGLDMFCVGGAVVLKELGGGGAVMSGAEWRRSFKGQECEVSRGFFASEYCFDLLF